MTSTWDWKALLGIAVIAGLAQVTGAVLMYLAGVYFVPWSRAISVLLLLLSIVVGTRWYARHCMKDEMAYSRALIVGLVISITTGALYALYNLISIAWFYPNFRDDMDRAGIEMTVPEVAFFNFLRLSVFGLVLSLVTAVFVRRRAASTHGMP